MPRSRKPTAILDLTGRLKHDKKRFANRKDEPTENGPLGDPPPSLGLDQSAIWREIKGHLVVGVALASDRVAFEELVRLVHQTRTNDISDSGRAAMIKLFAMFGMTPSERSKVAAPKKPADANPFSQIS